MRPKGNKKIKETIGQLCQETTESDPAIHKASKA
jgi:hypothetical protein